jgi:hypothetical protein
MSGTQLKDALKKHIDDADDRLLKMIMAMIEVYQEEEDDPVISYDVFGNPRRASELRAILREQVEEGRKGKYITVDELDEKSKQWIKGTK